MKTLLKVFALATLATGPALAQDAPDFVTQTYPDYAIDEAMGLMGALEGEGAALDAKTQQLISLGVAAQVPCQYCIYFHTRAARTAGASEAEIKAAVAAAADVRMWSTVLNGMGYDLDAFKAETDELFPTN